LDNEGSFPAVVDGAGPYHGGAARCQHGAAADQLLEIRGADPDSTLRALPAMTARASEPLPPEPAEAGGAALHSTGILPYQAIRRAIDAGEITAAQPIAEAQVQPASLDLRLGPVAYRVRCSFLPGGREPVARKLEQLAMHQCDLDGGAVLERDCVYIVPLLESLALRAGVSAVANPKSSTGRLDVFARLITDQASEFDRVRERYRGPLYAEIAPRSFSIRVETGSRLVQLRLKRGAPQPSEKELRQLHRDIGLIDGEGAHDPIDKARLAVGVDTEGGRQSGLIGYKARRHAGLIDVEKIAHYDPLDFWDPVFERKGRGIILDPSEFYILASKELVTVPPGYAAEMVAYDTLVGEFRVHYAGFFDPGFGYAQSGAVAGAEAVAQGNTTKGTRAVLEVRSHDVPFLLEDGQVVGRLFYERLTEPPERRRPRLLLPGPGPDARQAVQAPGITKEFSFETIRIFPLFRSPTLSNCRFSGRGGPARRRRWRGARARPAPRRGRWCACRRPRPRSAAP